MISNREESVSALSATQTEVIGKAMQDLLQSPPMRGTLQCQHLLEYIVGHTLTGDLALLRERVIGKEVFGRKPDYEPGEDPVVRIRAADLRKRLAVYYQTSQREPEVRIDVPSGSYKANFVWKSEAAVLALGAELERMKLPPESAVTEPPPVVSKAHVPHGTGFRLAMWMLLAAIVLIAVTGGVIRYRGRADRTLLAFWEPLLASPRPVLISIGSNAVYRVSDAQSDAYARTHHLENSGMEFFPEFAPDQTLASTGLYPAQDSFVALGDVASMARTVATLTHFSKTYQERFPNDISFAEVRNSPAILIGGFNNPMTRAMTRNYRFALTSRNRIEDHQTPGKTWELHASNDSHDTEDYAIITRVLRQKDDEPLVSVAGMGQYGTLAAAEFICSPESLNQLSGSLGKDWPKKNFQVVLRIRIADFKPASTSILAGHTW